MLIFESCCSLCFCFYIFGRIMVEVVDLLRMLDVMVLLGDRKLFRFYYNMSYNFVMLFRGVCVF